MQIAEGEVVAGRYRLEQALARGGMGSVWIARHLQLESQVAIKFMDATVAASPAARARFEREAKAAAQIHSPHVVTIHDYGVEGGTPFLVMELLKGEDLGARIKRVGALPLPVASGIITHVARALRLAHEAGIVHRDLKPGNVFLTINDDTEIAKVLDFGIAKTRGLQQQPMDPDEATRSDQILGSPQYMSPEQVKASRDVDHRSDLWSLAVIAYRALTAKLPFSSGSVAEVLVKICSEPPSPPSLHRPDLPSEVDRFFVRALAKDPDLRFQTASELAAAFAEAVGASASSDPTAVLQQQKNRRIGGRTIPAGPAMASAVAAAQAEIASLRRQGADVPTVRESSPDSFPEEAGPESTTVPFDRRFMPSPSSSGTTHPSASELLGGMTPHQLSVSSQDITHPKPPPAPPISTPAASPPARARSRRALLGGGIGLSLVIAAVLGVRVLGRAPAAAPSIESAAPLLLTADERPPVPAPAPVERAAPAPVESAAPAPLPAASPSASASTSAQPEPIPLATNSAPLVSPRPSTLPPGSGSAKVKPRPPGASKVPDVLKVM